MPLWAASSENEALTEAAKHVAMWFRDASLILFTKRLDAGVWEAHCVAGSELYIPVADILQDFSSSLGPEAVDELMLFPHLQEPGDLGTLGTYRPAMRKIVSSTWARHGIAEVVGRFVSARVGSRKGLVGSIAAAHRPGRRYSASDRAMMSTIAELTSLALS